MRAVKDHGVAPIENGPVDRFESLALPPGTRARAFHESGAKARHDRHDMRHAGDLGGGDADGSVARRFDKNDVGIGVAQDRAEFPHAAVLVPNGKLRWQRTGLSAQVRQNAKVAVRKFGREGRDAVAPIHHVENEGMAGIDEGACRRCGNGDPLSSSRQREVRP